MNDDSLQLVERRITVAEYQRLRAAVGWPEVAEDLADRGLGADLYTICVEDSDNIVACGRVIGDGGIYLYIQDVIVLPSHQGRGLGRQIMDRIMTYIDQTSGQNTFVALMAAEGVAPFYERYGFTVRPADRPGMFRLWQKS